MTLNQVRFWLDAIALEKYHKAHPPRPPARKPPERRVLPSMRELFGPEARQAEVDDAARRLFERSPLRDDDEARAAMAEEEARELADEARHNFELPASPGPRPEGLSIR